MLADNPSPTRWSVAVVATLAALGQLLTWVVGTVTSMSQGIHPAAWWQTARLVGSVVTAGPYVALIVWAAITGALVAAGTRGRAWPARWRNARLPLAAFSGGAAFAAGALVPMGLTWLHGSLGRVWPDAEGLADAPLMTLLLFAYSLLIPWLLGRLITRSQRRTQRAQAARVSRSRPKAGNPR
jgi:hypothetical protein